MKRGQELAGIEILRFVCAFAVLVWHYQHFFFYGPYDGAVGDAIRPGLPLHSVFAVFYERGYLAVSFFWAISGFIFYRQYAEAVGDGCVTIREFLVRRFSRLYPLHISTLIFVAACQYAYHASHRTTFIYSWNKPLWFISHLLFASNWLTRQPLTFNGPIWSVSVEILVYGCFFLVARAFRINTLAAAIVAATFLLGYEYLHIFISPEVFHCGGYFFAGGVAQRLSMHRAALPVAGCFAGAVVAVLMVGHYAPNDETEILLFASVVIVFAKLGDTAAGGVFRRVAFFGNATYASYLLHFPLQLLIVIIVDAAGWQRNIFYRPIAFLGFLALVIGTSLVVHRYFEMPAQNLIRAVASSTTKGSAVANRC